MTLTHRFRVAPGITLNVSNRAPSVSLGVRGRPGTRATVGIPGTGVFYTEAHPYGGAPMTLGRAIGNIFLGLFFSAVVLRLIMLFGCEESSISAAFVALS